MVGDNSSRVTLAWNYTATGGEQISLMRIQRLNNSNSNPVTLASRFLPSSQGKVENAFNKDGHFEFEDPTSLVINQVTVKDEFVYRCVVLTSLNSDGHKSDINLKVHSKLGIHSRRHLLDFLTVLLGQNKMHCFYYYFLVKKIVLAAKYSAHLLGLPFHESPVPPNTLFVCIVGE